VRPLAGVRVLDLSRLLPGPFASLVLADLGASVDKIEGPPCGDPLRQLPPLVRGESAVFRALNRDKRSACLDLKRPNGQRALLRMIAHYDVVLEQFRPGVLERLGLSPATMRARNSRLVVCSLTGYGQDGPLAHRAGHDINYLARAGVLGMQGPTEGPPQPLGVQLADIGGGLWSALAIVAALRQRDASGVGCALDLAMTEASMPFAFAGFAEAFARQPPNRGDGRLTGGMAIYGAYLTSDGEVMTLGTLEPKFWSAFCGGAGLETDSTAFVPGPHQAVLREKLRRLFASRSRAQWEQFAREHDCCLEPMLHPHEVLADEQLRARGAFFEIDDGSGDPSPQMRTPLTPREAVHTPAPKYGQHTDAILREAGIEESEIVAMRDEGTIPGA
jgi:crotonobetainyl-CoA:carnitine CoA-transferase CaiB-like acyl-CoA transferase